MGETCRANMFRNLKYVLLKRILTWSFQSCFSLWLPSVHWNCCLEEVTNSEAAVWSYCALKGRETAPCLLRDRRKQLDTNEGWRFHEAQLVDPRCNLTALDRAMICAVCRIHFLAGLCPTASEQRCLCPWPWFRVQTEPNSALWDPISSDNNHILLKAS